MFAIISKQTKVANTLKDGNSTFTQVYYIHVTTVMNVFCLLYPKTKPLWMQET